MDIFTTQLTQVAPNKIEPEKLKVKALAKEAKIHPVNDEIKELTEEERRRQQQKKKQQSVEQDTDKQSGDKQADSPVQEQNQSEDNSEQPVKHLDLYV
jgi:hypothetical protein